MVGWAACAREKRLMGDLQDGQERLVNDPGMRHEVSGRGL